MSNYNGYGAYFGGVQSRISKVPGKCSGKYSYGKKGSPEHEAIQKKILNGYVQDGLWKMGYKDAAVIGNEMSLLHILGIGKRLKNTLMADGAIVEKHNSIDISKGDLSWGEIVLIEVGNYTPSKWPGFPVVHIGIDKVVTLISKTNSEFEKTCHKLVCSLLDEKLCAFALNLRTARIQALLSLISLGKTNTQIADLKVVDLWPRYPKVQTNVMSFPELTVSYYLNFRIQNGEEVDKNSYVITSLPKGNKTYGEKMTIRSLQKLLISIYNPTGDQDEPYAVNGLRNIGSRT